MKRKNKLSYSIDFFFVMYFIYNMLVLLGMSYSH